MRSRQKTQIAAVEHVDALIAEVHAIPRVQIEDDVTVVEFRYSAP